MESKEEQIWDCPFCNKMTIRVIFIPSSKRQEKGTWGGSMPKYIKTKDSIIVESGCSNCGKSQKEVEKALKKGKSDVDKEKEILERLKGQGFSNEITTKF